jgi:pilus assembly protein CpaC
VPGVVSTSNPFGLLGRALSDMSGAQVGSACAGQFFPNVTGTVSAALSNTNSATQVLTNATGGPSGTLTSAVPSVGQTITSSTPCAGPNNAQGILKTLEQVGLVHMLAEPNLTAVSGETAKFLAGGEFPVPVSRDRDGNITVEFKQFGVGLSFTPVVLAPGRISLQLSSEVSELTNTGSFLLQGTSANGLSIPALSVRRTQTTVELPSGGSFAVAGLMQHNTKQVIDGFPGVKDLPVLGALFRSRDFADDQTELVVLVSAYLVEPNAASAFSAPTDGFVAPTDPETLLMGRLNATYKKKDDSKPDSAQAAGPVGFVVR